MTRPEQADTRVDQVSSRSTDVAERARQALSEEASDSLSSRGSGESQRGRGGGRADSNDSSGGGSDTATRHLGQLEIVDDSSRNTGRTASPELDSTKSPAELARAGQITDKTDRNEGGRDNGTERALEAQRTNDQTNPKITVELQDTTRPQTERPNFVIKANGEIEMHVDPEAAGSKDVRVMLERQAGQLNPTDQQQASADQLVQYLSDRLKQQNPNAQGVELDDRDNAVSAATEQGAGVRQPANLEGVPRETQETVGEMNRFRGSGGVDQGSSATDRMGSFGTRDVPRGPNETDSDAATKEAIAGLFRPDRDDAYNTRRRSEDGGYRVGRYGFSGEQIANYMSMIGDPPDPARIDELVKKGLLPASFADKLKDGKFFDEMKDFIERLKSGNGDISREEMEKFLPKELQERMADKLVDDMKGAVGDNPGRVAAAAMTGKTADQVSETDMSTPQSRQLAETGQNLYDVATRRQQAEGESNRVVGQIPTGERRELIDQALTIAGKPVTDANRAAVNLIVNHESGWNAQARNDWDINARRGQASRGLMQTIPSTFRAHAHPDYDQNIYDPLSNLVAGINYSYSSIHIQDMARCRMCQACARSQMAAVTARTDAA